MKKMKTTKRVLCSLLITLLAACSHLGADRLVESRFNYTAAMGESWKTQMLLNIVKMRYGDVPMFLSVQSVIDMVSLSTGVSLNGNWADMAPWSGGFGGNSQYTTAPTVTYVPMGGASFGKQMMTPLPPGSIAGLLQAGYPAEMILRLTVHAINGRENHFGLDNQTPVDSGFYRVIELIADLQASNAISLRVNPGEGGKESVIFSIHEARDSDSHAKLAELRQLLNLEANTNDFTLIYGARASNPNEIVLLSRSIIDILADLSGSIEVPVAHLTETRAIPAKPANYANGRPIKPLLTIHASADKPKDAAVLVSYHDYWYWISDRDINSKNAFSFLLFVMNLNNTGEDDESPDIVLPSGQGQR